VTRLRRRRGADGVHAKLLSQLAPALGIVHGGNVTVVAGPAVEIAKRYLEALFREDHESAYSLLDPDVEVVSPRRTTRGADRVRARWRKAEYDHLVAEVDRREYAEQNGSVRATTYMTWSWKVSGEIAYRTRVEGAFVIRDGRIARIETAVEHEAVA
jgi:ketosteroid isomerase-like protein